MGAQLPNLAIALALTLAAVPALAADPPVALPPPVPAVTLVERAPVAPGPSGALDLRSALDRALRQSPLVEGAKAGTEAFEARFEQAASAQYPHIVLDGLVTPMPGQRGSGKDGRTDLTQWGVFLRTELSGYLPVYGFGKIRHLKAAARLGVSVGRAREEVARAEVRYRVLQGFFALSFTRELKSVIDEGLGYFDKARRHLEAQKAADEPSFDPVDEMKIRVYAAQVRSRELEAARLDALALGNLRWALGEDPQGGPDVATPPLETIAPRRDLALDDAVQAAVARRPDLAALRLGVAAGAAEAKAKYWSMYPDVVLTGRFTASYCNVADRQSNPFLNNPYNDWRAWGGLAVRWDLDLGKRLGEWHESRSNRDRLQAELEEAERSVRLEVERLHREMVDARALVDAQQDALKAARGWVVSKLDLYENDLATLRDVMDGLLPFFQVRLDVLKATYDYNVALASLERATGLDLVPVGTAAPVARAFPGSACPPPTARPAVPVPPGARL